MLLSTIMASRDWEMKAELETVWVINTTLVELPKPDIFLLFYVAKKYVSMTNVR